MMARTWTVGAAGFLVSTACAFDTASVSAETASLGETESTSGETAATETGSDGTSTTGATALGSSSSTDPSDPDDPTTGTSTGTSSPTTGSDTDPSGGIAATVTVDGSDFGTVDYETTTTREYTLTNVGEEPAENLALVSSGPFTLEGTDCPESLAPSQTCIATISHDAQTLGPFSGELLIGYDDADNLQQASRALTAQVVGETGNLIPDPGFENCDVFDMPAGWDLLTEDGWYCGDSWATPHQGNRFLSGGGPLPDQNNFDIRFEVDLTPYQHAIATGSMTFEFRGHAVSSEFNNDSYRLRVRYRNDKGATLSVYNSGLQTTEDWTLYSDTREVPSGTTEAQLDLHCEKSNGVYCDAYFDTLLIVGRYSPK